MQRPAQCGVRHTKAKTEILPRSKQQPGLGYRGYRYQPRQDPHRVLLLNKTAKVALPDGNQRREEFLGHLTLSSAILRKRVVFNLLYAQVSASEPFLRRKGM